MGPLMTVLTWPVSMLFSVILTYLGWKLPTPTEVEKVRMYDKKVVVFSHTSYWDFWVMMMFMISNPSLFGDVYTVMKPQPFKGVQGIILRSLGFIASTRKEESGKGFVKKVTRVLRKKDKFLLLISPKGTIAPVGRWRTGYYYIAKELNVPILTVGFDYERRKVVVLNYTTVKEGTAEEISQRLIWEMDCIVPLNPEWTLSNVRIHDPKNRYPIDYFAALSILDWYVIYTLIPSEVGMAITLLLYACIIMLKPVIGDLKFMVMVSAFLRAYLYMNVIVPYTTYLSQISSIAIITPLVMLPMCTFFSPVENEMHFPKWYGIDRLATLAIMASVSLFSSVL